MTTREELKEIRSYPKKFGKMCSELHDAFDRCFPASPIISDMPKGFGDPEKMSDAISILEDQKNQLYEYVAGIRSMELRAWNDTLKIENPDERHTIVLYYFQRVDTWEEVADIMNYSLSQVKRLRDAAYEFLSSC